MSFEHPTMQMVPWMMKEENKESDDYEPKVVSLGPYHHGKEKLKFVEDFKPEAVKMFIGDSDKSEHDFMIEILKDIVYARSCYLKEVTSKYSDEVFARMMLRDACLILNYIGPKTEAEKSVKKINTINHLGSTVFYTNIRRDMYLLENQVPFTILKILVSLRYDTDLGDKFLKHMETYCFNMFFHDNNIHAMPNALACKYNIGREPVHLLEIFHSVIATGVDHESTPPADHCCDINKLVSCIDDCCFSRSNEPNSTPGGYVFRSVTDLKSKGIAFRASRIKSLNGARFSPTKLCQSAKLKLPSWHVTMYDKVFFMNMIAYELTPKFSQPKSVIAYVSFMKLLIVSKEDVKELREKGIIINNLGSDEQVVQLYNALNTYEVEDSSSYYNVKKDIEKHYNSKVKMWMADFKTTYFNNPWSIIALAGSIVLLILTIIQTYYAGHDNGDKCCPKGKFHLD